MEAPSTLQRPRSKGNYYSWIGVFVLILSCLVWFLYYSTQKN